MDMVDKRDARNGLIRPVEFAPKALMALWLLFSAASVHAMSIDFEPIVGTITGTDFVATPIELAVGARVRVILSDLGVPEPFQQLAFGWFNESDGLPVFDFGLDAPGILDVDLEPGNYLAVVGGIAGGEMNIGTFGLEISNTPIPAAGWLFLSSLLGLHYAARKRAK